MKQLNNEILKFKEDKTSVSYQIREMIYQSLLSLFNDNDIKITLDDVEIEHPEEQGHGDYSTNIALKLQITNYKLQIKSKLQITNPRELAEEIVKNLPKADFVEKVEVAGPGFINFWLTEKYLLRSLENSIQSREKYGRSEIGRGQKIMVEFAHPNTHKLFHIGHLRNITIGEAICRLLSANGAEVIRANYQGDVGLHIAKCLYGITKNPKSKFQITNKIQNPNFKLQIDSKFKTLDEKIHFLGEAYREGNKAYEENEQAKKEIEEINHKIYQKEPSVVDLWQETRAWSLEYFDRIYQRLGTKFDRLYFESEVADLGKKLVMENLKVFEKSEGAIIFDGEKYGLHKRVFINSQGLPTYEAKDIGLAQLQFKEYHPDLIIHNVGPEQSGYFQVLFKALEGVLPDTRGREYHRIYGWVRLKEGKMSSRAGKVVLGEWLLEEVKKKLAEIIKGVQKSKMVGDEMGTTEALAVAGIKYAMLKLSAERELVFDIDESVSLEGDSGVYLEYVYARTLSVLAKSKFQISNSKFPRKILVALGSRGRQINSKIQITNKEELAILRTIYQFPEVVREAGEKLSPNVLSNYLYDLAGKFNTFYNRHRILASENESFRLALTASVGQVMKNGLEILGIKAVETM